MDTDEHGWERASVGENKRSTSNSQLSIGEVGWRRRETAALRSARILRAGRAASRCPFLFGRPTHSDLRRDARITRRRGRLRYAPDRSASMSIRGKKHPVRSVRSFLLSNAEQQDGGG